MADSYSAFPVLDMWIISREKKLCSSFKTRMRNFKPSKPACLAGSRRFRALIEQSEKLALPACDCTTNGLLTTHPSARKFTITSNEIPADVPGPCVSNPRIEGPKLRNSETLKPDVGSLLMSDVWNTYRTRFLV